MLSQTKEGLLLNGSNTVSIGADNNKSMISINPKSMDNSNISKVKNGKHLIMDLDETLVHTFEPRDNFDQFYEELTPEQKSRIYVLRFPNGDVLSGYVRPFAEEFLKTAFDEFETVSVWSAGTKNYVDMIVDVVFKDQRPHFIMSRTDCNELKLKDENTACRFKPLEVVYHRHPTHNESNTIIVDDRHDICKLNCMNNIRIPEFLMDNFNYEIYVNDKTLSILADWFRSNEFRSSKDVRSIKSRSPFKI